MKDYINIVGFEVFNQEANYIGTVKGVIKSEQYADILIIKNCDREILIPILYKEMHYINLNRREVFIFLPKECNDVYKSSIYLDDSYNIFDNYYYCLYEN
jgi:ribosomal 30S subunit maturation factor RimM